MLKSDSAYRFSHKLEVSYQILQQRVAAVEREFEQKYSDAKEQLKNDPRLMVDAIVQHDEKIKLKQWY